LQHQAQEYDIQKQFFVLFERRLEHLDSTVSSIQEQNHSHPTGRLSLERKNGLVLS
jgi:hypothetical protein